MIFSLDNQSTFPDPRLSEPDGLLAIGGDLSSSRLRTAYEKGIFPWYNNEDPILWWSPNPRCILNPAKVKISKSMRAVLNKDQFQFTINKNFLEVIKSCSKTPRKEESDTWINDEIIEAYLTLHKEGYAHSVEVWKNNKIVGGLYGLAMGKMFFGESMFSTESNASKAGFIWFCKKLEKLDFTLIDCQIHNSHLESLGAIEIPRDDFLALLEHNDNTKVTIR